jgi:hypothetical protein
MSSFGTGTNSIKLKPKLELKILKNKMGGGHARLFCSFSTSNDDILLVNEER